MGQSWPADFVPWYKKYCSIHSYMVLFTVNQGMLLLVYTVSRKHHFWNFLWCRNKTWTLEWTGLDWTMDWTMD